MTTIKGEFEIGSQYHFHMELQSCVVRPKEDGEFELYSTTQWISLVQFTVAKALNVNENKIHVAVRYHTVVKHYLCHVDG